MGVHHHQIGCDLVPGDDITLGYPCQHPDLSTALQRTSGFIGDALAQQVIGKLERVHVLHHLVAVRHDPQSGLVGAAGVDLVAGDLGAVLRVNVPLLHRPIQPGSNQGIRRCRGFLYFRPQTVPGSFSHIKHRFHICSHH